MIIKTTPDKERAQAIVKLVEQREAYTKNINMDTFPTMIAESYYEILKELMTAIALADGYKTAGENAHKDLVDYLSNYHELHQDEIALIDDLRIRRNKSMYEGKQIELVYVRNNKDKLLAVIQKLKAVVKTKVV